MDDVGDVQARWKDGLSRLASRAYRAASTPPAPEPRPVRWRIDRVPALAIGGALAVALVVAWHSLHPTEAPTPGVSIVSGDEPLTEVVVHVAGAVVSPGIATLGEGSRVADAVEAAGGLTAEADQSAINLARVVRDGEQVFVPTIGEGGSGMINVNRASPTELEALPGIGPVLAERIVSDREVNGPFASIEDLSRVSGIGSAIISQIATLATV